MPKLTVDGRTVEVDPGSTVLDAARRLGIAVPTLCYKEGLEPNTSCMVCVVKVEGRGRLAPSCATPAEDGMAVDTRCEEVREARRMALELLLSDHTGDCEGPCRIACPASMDIPRMLREIQSGDWPEASATARLELVLPETLSYICRAPCERACRRGRYDAAVAIRALHRTAARRSRDGEREAGEVPPERAQDTGKRVAIVGAGPAGLAAAFELSRQGHTCTVFDDRAEPGGMLRYGIPAERLPREVLAAEIDAIRRTGVAFRMESPVRGRDGLDALRGEHDAALLATGANRGIEDTQDKQDSSRPSPFGIETTARGVAVDPATFATSEGCVFAAGAVVRPIKEMAARAVGLGRGAAAAIHRFLVDDDPGGRPKEINVSMGRLSEEEISLFLESGSNEPRVVPQEGGGTLSDADARREAGRCLHCDCRAARDCRLRDLATQYAASPSRYRSERRPFARDASHPRVIYEPGKCIACGLCIQVAQAVGEPLGQTFLGRGFAVRVGPPFGEPLAEALRVSGEKCVEVCPTGALALKED